MKPELRRFRRALAGAVTALLMAAGIVVLSPAVSASAHHNTISVSASCTNYVWSIDWKLVNSEYDKTETITTSSDQNIISTGTVLAQSGTFTKSETVTGPVTKTLTVSAQWSNGVTNTNSATIYPSDFRGTCEAPDTPSLTVSSTCSSPSYSTGTVEFTLSGVSTAYTVDLLEGSAVRATVTSSGGSGVFTNVAAGTYTVRASVAGGPSATSSPVTIGTCTTAAPEIELVIESCVTAGTPAVITAGLSGLAVGSSYVATLFTSADLEVDSLAFTATATTRSVSFSGHAPGAYYATVSDGGGSLLAVSSDVTSSECAGDVAIAVQLEPCPQPAMGTDRAITVQVDGLAASTVYTVQLVTDDTAQTVVDQEMTPGDNASTFAHTFTSVPAPGDYVVRVLGGSAPVVSSPISAIPCDLTTLAPPSVDLLAHTCEGVGSTIRGISATLIDLDATQTYFVRIVDTSGATVAGGEDQSVTGVTTATVEFPTITTSGTYSAQLLVNPGMQLAATSPTSVDLTVCLPTLAMTGPSALVPLGSVAALLLTLGGAVVMGRLRRRMAL